MTCRILSVKTMLITAVAASLLGSMTVHAQVWEASEPQVMDRATSDMDPMAANLRYVNRNLSATGTMTRIHNPYDNFAPQGNVYIDPATGISGRTRPYRLEGQGFVAYLHRPLYLVKKEEWEKERGDKYNARTDYAPRKDGEWTALIPPNTVYDLHPVPVMTPEEVLAHAALQQAQIGQTNEEVGNIPTNPFFIPAEQQQVETRINTQIVPRQVDRMVYPQEMTSQVELRGTPGSRLSYEIEDQAYQKQVATSRMFEARKAKWLAMKEQLNEERILESQQADGEVLTIEVDSPERIQSRLDEIEQELEREAADREKMEQQAQERR